MRSDLLYFQSNRGGKLNCKPQAELGPLNVHAEEVLCETYLPEEVLAEKLDGKWKPALCYVCPAIVPRAAKNDGIDRIVTPARKYDFPDWYVERVQSFR